ncbi:MAG: UDP-N-acetylglucosamine--N-acetylmuramyl-(pentapeptide) pyrophosphoryl-undecaprenol N-acetylglucosamine transferase [Candidatus Colwellbacteria bacterium]|nr:UDP-N-acetylglucosamine--N-acetylmuramyl-(pentapeptide) pyrophosphoryl-undecaprenol N-acetylglucosamine transferase [Candidatus Colwellbacteria bacterium]
MHKTRITIVGGGTAGHLHPLIAVGIELQLEAVKKGAPIEVSYIGTPGDYAVDLIKNGVKVKKIAGSRIRRYVDIENLFEGPKLIFGFFQSLWHLFWIMPDVVFSKGGTGALAPIIAARFYRIPVVIHESDAVPSLNGRLVARLAKHIFASFEEVIPLFKPKDRKKCEIVGTPIRQTLLSDIPDKESAKETLGFDPHKRLILILGGSQGSQRINNLILAGLPELLSHNIQILHQTGANLFSDVADVLGGHFNSIEEMRKAGYEVVDFLKGDMKVAYSAADLIISRAGSSIFEFAAFGKPSILIPLPEAAQNHQLMNARSYEAAGACVLMEEKDISVPAFIEKVTETIESPSIMERLSSSAKAFAKPQAASKIAIKLLELANG